MGADFLRGLCGANLRATGGTTETAYSGAACRPREGYPDTGLQQLSFSGQRDRQRAGPRRLGSDDNQDGRFGAQGTDDDYTAILEYLVKNFPANPPVNVNKATAAQLASGLGFTTAESEAVVTYRDKNGDFKTLDDLKKVPDLDAKKVDAKKARITF